MEDSFNSSKKTFELLEDCSDYQITQKGQELRGDIKPHTIESDVCQSAPQKTQKFIQTPLIFHLQPPALFQSSSEDLIIEPQLFQ